jgi:hypothetical protein
MASFSDPLALFNAALASLQKEEWPAVTALCDVTSLAAFRRQLVGMIIAHERIPTLTVEQYAAMSPDMPREVAEYNVKLHNDANSEPIIGYGGFTKAQEAEHMSDAEVFNHWLASQSPRARPSALDPGRIYALITDQPQFTNLNFEALGVIDIGEPIAHVFYRSTPSALVVNADDTSWHELGEAEKQLHTELARSAHVAHVKVRRQPDGSWRLVASHNFFELDSWAMGFTHEFTDENPEG